MIVPVLSKTTILTSFIVWIASPFLISIPLFAPIPEPTINAVGVASPRAQGQAITKTATATPRDLLKSPEKYSQFKNVKIAKAKITGTKTEVILSASLCIGTFVPCASSTNLIICAKNVSLPTFVAFTYKIPS